MPPKRPYLVTPTYYNGLSRTQFRRLPKAARRDAMLEWFLTNYEDPVHRTPYESAEGGYIYIWGGPYDASDLLGDMFSGLATEELIQEVVDEVEEDGTLEWTEASSPDDYDDAEPPEDDLPELEDIPDEAGPAYGSPQDRHERTRVVASLGDLRKIFDAPRAVGIGHNRPPEDIEAQEVQALSVLRPTIVALEEEFQKETPRIPTVKLLAFRLRDVAIATGTWLAKKLDIMVDEAAKTGGRAIGVAAVALEPHVRSAIDQAFHAVVNWLHLVTLPF